MKKSSKKELPCQTKSFLLLEQELMKESDFKNIISIDDLDPEIIGMYCLRIRNVNILPDPFKSILNKRKHNIIYIGIAEKDLRKRLNQELRGQGHGTFFRSIGAILGYRPPQGSLVDKSNKSNYKFSTEDTTQVVL